jgi:hypothetical protein
VAAKHQMSAAVSATDSARRDDRPPSATLTTAPTSPDIAHRPQPAAMPAAANFSLTTPPPSVVGKHASPALTDVALEAMVQERFAAYRHEAAEEDRKRREDVEAKMRDDAARGAALETMRESNARLREAIERAQKDRETERERLAAEMNGLVKVQAQMLAAVAQLQHAEHGGASASNTVSSIAGRVGPFTGGAATQAEADMGTAVAGYDAMQRFMTGIGLGKFVPALLQHDVDIAALRGMSETDLASVGIGTIGARRKIKLEVEKLAAEDAESKAEATRGSPRSHDAKIVAATGGPAMSLSAVELRRHERILKRFFDRVDEPQLASRAEIILRQFHRQLDALYSALAHKYEVLLSRYRPSMVSFLRREGLTYLLPAVDIICFNYDGREAEFAEMVMLEHLCQHPQALTWLVFEATEDEIPPAAPPARRARSSRQAHSNNPSGSVTPQTTSLSPIRRNQSKEDNAASDGNTMFESSPYYYYNALVHLSQWEAPRVATRSEISAVVEAPFRSKPASGGRLLEPNPLAKDMIAVQSVNHRYIAATVALLMRYDPTRLTQFDSLCRQYSVSRDVEYARGGGDDAKQSPLNAKKLYVDLRQWYAARQPAGIVSPTAAE